MKNGSGFSCSLLLFLLLSNVGIIAIINIFGFVHIPVLVVSW